MAGPLTMLAIPSHSSWVAGLAQAPFTREALEGGGRGRRGPTSLCTKNGPFRFFARWSLWSGVGGRSGGGGYPPPSYCGVQPFQYFPAPHPFLPLHDKHSQQQRAKGMAMETGLPSPPLRRHHQRQENDGFTGQRCLHKGGACATCVQDYKSSQVYQDAMECTLWW